MGNYILLTDINKPDSNGFFTGDDFSTVYVGAGATIAGGASGLAMLTNNITLTVAGHVFGQGTGVALGYTNAVAGSAVVLEGASVTGGQRAMLIYGQASVVNFGAIASGVGDPISAAIETNISAALTLLLENHGTIYCAPQPGGRFGAAFLGGVEADTIVNTGLILGHVLTAGGTDDYDGRGGTLSGTIDLGTGNDSGTGGDGGERFLGSAGHDEFDGGGTDTYDGSAGTARLTADLGLGYVVSNDLGSDSVVNFENLFGGSNNDLLTGDLLANVLRGNGGNDRLTGLGNDDRLAGGSGNDVLLGGDGNDRLSGDDRVDLLNGGAGNDRLHGGFDIDTMTGGGGLDVFVFKDPEETFAIIGLGNDTITDFVRGQDKIDLSVIDANNFDAAGEQAFVFVGTAALTLAGQLGYRFEGGNTVISMNPNFPGEGIDAMVLTGLIALTAEDFLL